MTSNVLIEEGDRVVVQNDGPVYVFHQFSLKQHTVIVVPLVCVLIRKGGPVMHCSQVLAQRALVEFFHNIVQTSQSKVSQTTQVGLILSKCTLFYLQLHVISLFLYIPCSTVHSIK